MKAIQVGAFGGPDALRLVDTAVPVPGPDEVLVRLARAGVNYIDVYMRSGVYARSGTYKTPLPMTVGMEGAGTVEAVGTDVSEWKRGDKVAYCLSRGSYAEFAVVPAWKLVAIPEGIGFDIATALMLQGSTAHYLSHATFALGHEHVCLIHAGAGGVGQLLIQLAKHRGATVITTVGTEEKAKIASSRGADHCILYGREDFGKKVKVLTGGEGVHVVYDSVGKDTIDSSIHCLRRRGLCVLFGSSSGTVANIEPLALAEVGSVFFTRPHLSDYLATAEERRLRAHHLFETFKAGRLDVVIDDVIPLQKAADAHRCLEGRGTKGKLVLDVSR
jgi:NADPH2:quinone reductase